jgi:hypothetical protein
MNPFTERALGSASHHSCPPAGAPRVDDGTAPLDDPTSGRLAGNDARTTTASPERRARKISSIPVRDVALLGLSVPPRERSSRLLLRKGISRVNVPASLLAPRSLNREIHIFRERVD